MAPPFADSIGLTSLPSNRKPRPFGGFFQGNLSPSLDPFGQDFRAPAPKRPSFPSSCPIKGRPSATRRCFAFSFRRGVYASRTKRARLCLLRAPPCRRRSPRRRKWTASPGGRCARLRSRSGRRARRSSAARAAKWSSSRCPSSKVNFPRVHEASRRAWLGATGAVGGEGGFPGPFLEWAAASLAEPRSLLLAPSLPSLFFAFTLGEKLLLYALSHLLISFPVKGKGKKGWGGGEQPFLSTFHCFSLVSRTLHLIGLSALVWPRLKSIGVFTFLLTVIQVDVDNNWLFKRVGDKRGTDLGLI